MLDGMGVLIELVGRVGHDDDIERMVGRLRVCLRGGGHIVRDPIPSARDKGSCSVVDVSHGLELGPCFADDGVRADRQFTINIWQFQRVRFFADRGDDLVHRLIARRRFDLHRISARLTVHGNPVRFLVIRIQVGRLDILGLHVPFFVRVSGICGRQPRLHHEIAPERSILTGYRIPPGIYYVRVLVSVVAGPVPLVMKSVRHF